jgi:multiple sugar transport system permease protein
MATIAQTKPVAGGVAGKRKFNWTPYFFILPHLLLFGVFIGWPFVYGLAISFQQYDILRPEANKFIGLDNYTTVLLSGGVHSKTFYNALGNTVTFVLYSVIPLVVLALLLALLLNTKVRGVNLFRAIYFAPWVLSVAVIGILWWWIFQSQGGLINYYLQQLGFPTPRWLSTLPWAWIAITVATVWWTVGFNMIILLAALQDIPDQLYEAAAIDGATGSQAFFRITLPMLRPVLAFVVTITIIASFNLFGQPFFMTQGNPPAPGGAGGGTEPIMYRIYIAGFTGAADQGRAAAMSIIVAVLMIGLSFLNFKLFSERT